MKIKLFGSLGGLAAIGLVMAACGDDTTSSAGATTGDATTGGATTSTTGGTGGAGGAAADCSMEADEAACRACCVEQHPVGYAVLRAEVAAACGCTDTGACYAECAMGADPICTGGTPTTACGDCLSALGAGDACSAGAAFSAACQMDEPDCAAVVSCFLSCP